MRSRLHTVPLPIQVPIGAVGSFVGVVDLIELKAITFRTEEFGSTFVVGEIPVALRETAQHWRRSMLETLAESCESFMDLYLRDQMSAAEIRQALRAATIARTVTPVLCGSSLRYIGVQRLLDAVCDYLPSPLDVPPIQVHDGDRVHEITCDPGAPLAALVFKIIADKPVDLYFLRVYSGILKSGMRVFNPRTGEKENISRMYRMFAKRRDQTDEALAGDIVAVLGPRETLTGDTLCDPRRPVLLESIDFPDTVISVSVEPRSSRDRDKLLEALRALQRQDPTISVSTNSETGQTLISGMGELHLEIVTQRLRSDMHVDVLIGKPRVAYRETVRGIGEGEGHFDRQIGGRRHFARASIRLEPRAHARGRASFEFISEVKNDGLDLLFVKAVERGVIDASQSGILGGYVVIDWKATLLDADVDQDDSSELAFENAGRSGFYAAMKQAAPVLLQPIMDVEVMTPSEYFGAIIGDLTARQATIRNTVARETDQLIDCQVPLSQMFGYVTRLRSLSQGRATCSMMPSHYAPVTEVEMRALVG